MGLFMVLPVLALYVDQLTGATPLLIGLALGIYGLTQAALQIPMGYWSDRIGRKRVIAFGLVIFAAGGAIAASTGHIVTVLIGRAVQGAGAISGTALALAADVTRTSQRTKVMAIIGVCIGGAFSVAFIVGPVLDNWVGLSGLFWISAALGLAALPVLFFLVPDPPPITPDSDGETNEESLLQLVRSPGLRLLYTGVFCLHGILAASFVSIPVLLSGQLGIPSDQHYTVYIPVIVMSLLFTVPLFALSGRMDRAAFFFRFSVGCIGLAEILLWHGGGSRLLTTAALVIFFVGFNFLEASLPSMISMAIAAQRKGAALGTYSTAQFIGMFIGGITGGAVASILGSTGVFVVNAGLAGVWLIYTLKYPVPGTRAARAT